MYMKSRALRTMNLSNIWIRPKNTTQVKIQAYKFVICKDKYKIVKENSYEQKTIQIVSAFYIYEINWIEFCLFFFK